MISPTKCQECLAEIRTLISFMGGEAKRIMKLSTDGKVKKRAEKIYSKALEAEELLRAKNGKELLFGKENANPP